MNHLKGILREFNGDPAYQGYGAAWREQQERRNGHTHDAPNPSKIHPVPGCYKCEEEVRLFTGG